MDRLTLTPDMQAAIDGHRFANGTTDGDTVVEGTNLVVDDHIRVDDSWNAVIVRGAGGISVDVLVPEWWEFWPQIFTAGDSILYVTDRAGPTGQTMPIVDEMQMQALAEKRGNPKQAAKDARNRRRAVIDDLRSALERVPNPDVRKRAEAGLRSRGLLDMRHESAAPEPRREEPKREELRREEPKREEPRHTEEASRRERRKSDGDLP